MNEHDVTLMLGQARRGHEDAAAMVWAALQSEIQRLADVAGTDDHPNTVSNSVLLDAAFKELFAGEIPSWQDRAEFLDAVAQAMSTFLRDRHRNRTRTGDIRRQDLTGTSGELTEFTRADSEDGVRALDIVDEIGRESPDTARVARLRFVLGLNNDQTARTLGIDSKTAELKWRFSQAVIRRGLARGLNE